MSGQSHRCSARRSRRSRRYQPQTVDARCVDQEWHDRCAGRSRSVPGCPRSLDPLSSRERVRVWCQPAPRPVLACLPSYNFLLMERLFRMASATSNRLENVDAGTSRYRSVESLQIADIFPLQEDVHKGAHFARLVAQVEPQAGKIVIECRNDLTNGATTNRHRCAVTDFRTQRTG